MVDETPDVGPVEQNFRPTALRDLGADIVHNEIPIKIRDGEREVDLPNLDGSVTGEDPYDAPRLNSLLT